MKIYINNIRIENFHGIKITAENLCELMGIPKENAIVSDEDMNHIPFGEPFQVKAADKFFIIRRIVSGS